MRNQEGQEEQLGVQWRDMEVGCNNKQSVRQAILPFLKGRTTIPFLSKTKVQLCRPQAQLLPGLRKPNRMGMSYRIVQQFHLMGRMRLMFHQHGRGGRRWGLAGVSDRVHGFMRLSGNRDPCYLFHDLQLMFFPF